MSSLQIQLALWISQPVLQTGLALIIYRRKLHKRFPAFFWYTVAQVVFFAATFPIRDHYNLYYHVYYVLEALNVILAFKIIHEVFLDIFRPYPALKDLGTALFRWAAMIMILASIVMVAVSPGWDDPIHRALLVVDRVVDMIQCGMVIFLLAFCQNLGVSWRRPSFGIALGFGVFSGIELLTEALLSGHHIRTVKANSLNMMGYEASLLLWLAYSLYHQVQTAMPVLVPQRWDEALVDIQPHKEADSLIPMFEHMVEQAFSKTQDRGV